MYILYLLLYSLGKERCSSFDQTVTPLTQRYFMPGLVEIEPVVLEKSPEM